MKKVFIALGKIFCYFTLYLGTQVIVSVVFSSTLALWLVGTGAVSTVDFVTMQMELSTAIMPHLMTIVLIANVICLLSIWLILAIRKKKFLNEIRLYKIPNKLYLPLGIFALALNMLTVSIMDLLPIDPALMESYNASSDLLFTGNIVVAVFSVVIVAPVFEEILFRGIIYTRAKAGMPIIVAAILSSLLFGVAHGHIIWVIYATLLALTFVYLFELTGSLLTCIYAHFIYNASGLLLSLIPDVSPMVMTGLLIASILIIAGSHTAIKRQLNNQQSKSYTTPER